MHRLIAHPAKPAIRAKGVQVRWSWLPGGVLLLRWRIDGASGVVLPPFAGSGRADDLWKATCLELFLDLGGGCYREFNFSPSGRWAAYDFTSYRVNAGNAEVSEHPVVSVERGSEIIAAAVRVPAQAIAGATRGALSAVVEEEGGVTSFWSSLHRKDQPDFHDPTCFVLTLPPPLAP